MATADDLRRSALALEGTIEAPHFDRRAFKARRIYATLAADGLTANLRYPPEEQAFRCEAQPEAYRKVANKFGDAGWTTATLAALSVEELRVALTSAWRHQAPVPKKTGPRRRS